MFSQEFSLFVVFTLCPFPLSAQSLIARWSPCTCGIAVFRSYSYTPDCLFLRLQIQTCNWLHDEISLELKANGLVVKRFASSPLFWCGGLWWFFVPCWVTILSGKWNLELSTGQEDPTSPEAKFIQAFLCARQMSCSIYAERNTPVYCVGFLPTPILSFPYFNLVCLY